MHAGIFYSAWSNLLRKDKITLSVAHAPPQPMCWSVLLFMAALLLQLVYNEKISCQEMADLVLFYYINLPCLQGSLLMDSIYCPNSTCPDYQKAQGNRRDRNIIRHGRTIKGVRRFRCKTCGKTFTETVNTYLYRKRKRFVRELTWALDRFSVNELLEYIASVLDTRPNIFLGWANESLHDHERIDEILSQEYGYSPGEIKDFWRDVEERLSRILDSEYRRIQ